MKILHTADWHIGQFKGPVVDGVNLRLQDTVKCLEYMVEVAQKEKPDIVCISGDIFHQEQIGPVRYSDEMIIATDTITKLADIAKGVIVMRGTPNHDGSGQFRVLDRMFAKTSHVHIITAPTVLHTPYTDIACIPGFDKQEFRAKFPGLSADEENLAWTKYISDMVFALRAECEKTPILMAHYTVPGCNMESGQTSFFTNFEPVIPREGAYQMKLKLNYVPDWKNNGGSSGGKQDDTWNKNYQVTARSGLNMRKEPNGAIITTIPYGKTVKGDGTSKNGWHHVKYGNNTGYCYSVWLKET